MSLLRIALLRTFNSSCFSIFIFPHRILHIKTTPQCTSFLSVLFIDYLHPHQKKKYYKGREHCQFCSLICLSELKPVETMPNKWWMLNKYFLRLCSSKIMCRTKIMIFLFIYFYQLEANYFTILQWFLSYIEMNQPWIYMCSPSRSPLPPPSPSHCSGSSQCTSPEHLSHASNLGW